LDYSCFLCDGFLDSERHKRIALLFIVASDGHGQRDVNGYGGGEWVDTWMEFMMIACAALVWAASHKKSYNRVAFQSPRGAINRQYDAFFINALPPACDLLVIVTYCLAQ
jgi:hypothetical protein